MSDGNEVVRGLPQWKADAYDAVWHSGLLTPDAMLNARIWRAVEAALDTIEPIPSAWAPYQMPPTSDDGR